MPRIPRVKADNGVYHIIMRGPKEISLFRSKNDKDKFLTILKKYKNIFLFDVFAYCLMDTHIHLLIDSKNADISMFMKSINQSYAQYYNKIYDRRGHVFMDRFKSFVASKEENIVSMSAYIHNNPKDIRGYSKTVENYDYSSFGIYIGKTKNKYNIINCEFLLNYYCKDPIKAAQQYYTYVKNRCTDKEQHIQDILINFSDKLNLQYNLSNDTSYYFSGVKPLVKDITPKEVLNFFFKEYNLDSSLINIKYNRKISNYRAIIVLIMRSFCNYTFQQISNIINNFTHSSLSRLCTKGYLLISNDAYYKNIAATFLEKYSVNYNYD
ncbi:transposase [uncultured Clostridium sp.]|uniref:transposase n=1 Tax=uncultured Clostridium sp. TaxID=59620 RepID=UPI0028EEECC8|nr:transposase [uncultured Clostridium sp.]